MARSKKNKKALANVPHKTEPGEKKIVGKQPPVTIENKNFTFTVRSLYRVLLNNGINSNRSEEMYLIRGAVFFNSAARPTLCVCMAR